MTINWAFEGLIGVGKTTLARAMADELGCALVSESDITNPFLAKSYASNDGRWNLACQLQFLERRVVQSNAALDLPQGFIADYSFAKEAIFAAVTLDGEEWQLYQRLAQHVVQQVRWQPELTIYLRSSMETVIERIVARNRSIEKRLTRNYLERLQQEYDAWIFDAEGGRDKIVVVNNEGHLLADDPGAMSLLIDHCRHAPIGVSYCNPIG